MMEIDTDMYLFLPSDLRLVVFDMEHELGITVGGGAIFNVPNKIGVGLQRAGRNLPAEESFVRLASLFIGSKHLNYSNSYLAKKFGCVVQMIYYANRVVSGHIETNPRFRKKIYTVAIKNGLMELAQEIEIISEKREAVKKVFN